MHIVTLASVNYGQVAVAIFITPKHLLYQITFLYSLSHLRYFWSTFNLRITVKTFHTPTFHTLPDHQSPAPQARQSYTTVYHSYSTIHSWPILLHGHTCHWYSVLNCIYIHIRPSSWQPSSRRISRSKSGRGPIFDISETALKVHQSPKQKTLFILVLIQLPLAQFHPPPRIG